LHGKEQFEISDRDMEWIPAPKSAKEKTNLEYHFNQTDRAPTLGEVIDEGKAAILAASEPHWK
jgi:hypothetical protein